MTRQWISALFARRSSLRGARALHTRFGLELLEDRAAPAVFSEAGGTLNLDLNQANEAVTIVSNGTSYDLTLTGTKWAGTDSANVSGNGNAKLTVTAAGIAAFGTGINLTDSGAAASVTFGDSKGNAYANVIGVVLDSGSAGVAFKGASDLDGHALTVQADDAVVVTSGASVTTKNGGISLTASGAGSSIGIDVAGSITSTGAGPIVLVGHGGTGAAGLAGVRVSGGGKISSDTAGVSVTGTGGTGGASQAGVLVTGANSTINSNSGDVTVTGTGGGTPADTNNNNDGVTVQGGGSIRAGGSGKVSVTGVGGPNAGSSNSGVSVQGKNSVISAKDGALQVTGVSASTAGAPNADNVGVFVDPDGVIATTGAGTISLAGTGANDGGNRSQGVQLAGHVTTAGGDISIIGIGGSGTSNVGVALLSNAAVSSGGSGNVRVVADGVSLDAKAIIKAGGAGDKTATFVAATAGTLIDLGGADAPGTLGLTDAELDSVTAGRLIVGDPAGGAITISAAVTLTDGPVIPVLELNTAADINGSFLVKSAAVHLSAGTGIGETAALSLGATSIAADTALGAIDINNANSAATVVSSLTTGNGSIVFDQSGGGAVTIANAVTGLGDVALSNTKADLTLTNVTASGAGGNVSAVTTSSGDVLVGLVTAAGDVAIIAAGAITDDNGAANDLAAAALSLQAKAGIGSGDALETQVTSLSAKNTSSGTVELSNSGGLNVADLENVDDAVISATGGVDLDAVNVTGALDVTATGDISDAGNISVTGNARFDAGTGAITLGDDASETTTFGSLTFVTTGAVTITEDGATSLAGTNTAGTLVLTSTGSITDAANTSINVDGNAAFDAGASDITIGDNVGDTTNFGSLDAHGGVVSISEDSTTNLDAITATTLVLTSAGDIVDNNGAAANVTAVSAALSAAGGIGSGDALETIVSNLAFKSGQAVQIDNAGGLTVTDLGSLTTSSSAGAVTLTATSPIVFGVNTSAKSLLARAFESPVANFDNITVSAGVTVSATAGDVTFETGDRIIIAATSKVSASGNVSLRSGVNDADGDGSMALDGTISAGAGGVVTLDLNAQQGAAEAATGSITGGGLLLLASGAAGSFALDASTTNNVATIAAATAAPLAYRDAASLSIGTVGGTNGLTTGNSDATVCLVAGNLSVDQPANVGTGTLRLQTLAGNISGAAPITAAALGLRASGGGVSLTSTASNVGTLAGVTTGSFGYADVDGFSLGSVAAQGAFTPGVTSVSAGGDLELAVAVGDLIIDAPLDSGGIVRLLATSGSVGQKPGATISAGLGLGAAAGNAILLTEANPVTGALAASAANGVAILSTGSVTVSTVVAGTFLSATTGVTAGGAIDLSSAQVLTVSADVTSTATAAGAAINLRGDGGVTINNQASVFNNQAKAVAISVAGTGSAGHTDGIIVAGATVDAGGGDVTLFGAASAGTSVSGVRVQGSGVVQTSGAGKVLLTGVAPYIAGNRGVTITSGGRITAGGGDATKNLGLAPGSQINVELTLPGSFGNPFDTNPSTYDFVHVDGTVDLGNSSLNAISSALLPSHTTFMVLRNDGQLDGDGTFPIDTAVPLVINGQDYFLSYSKGDGNDVTLERNSPPVPSAGGPYVISEGNDLLLNASATTDVDNDQLTYQWMINGLPFTTSKAIDTVPWAALQDVFHVDDGPGKFPVGLNVTDGRYTRPAAATSLTLNNTAPTVQLFQPSFPTAVTAQTRAFVVTVTDPSHTDTAASFAFTINWGDGNTSTYAPTPLVDPFGSSTKREGGQHEIDDHSGTRFVFDHAYDFTGTYRVTITAADKDGGVSPIATTAITINTVEIQTPPGSKTGVLAVGGTPKGDRIAVISATTTSLAVYINGRIVAPTSAGAKASTRIPTSLVSHIAIFGGGGDDPALVNFSTVPAEIHGGPGNDNCCGSQFSKALIPGVPANLLKSAYTSDVLFGDGGADYLHNFGGNNLIIAGDGSDGHSTKFATINGRTVSGVDHVSVDGGSNIVIGGDLAAGPTRDTSYKGNPYNWTNLSAILQKWVLTQTVDLSILGDIRDTEKDLVTAGNNSRPHKAIADLFLLSLANPTPAPPPNHDRIDAFMLVPAGKDDKLRVEAVPVI
jgi:hypothetical protein